MSAKYDVVVIGGGHNGLVHAAYLARAGKKVLVLERRHIVGGAAVTEEVFPGFHFSVCSYVVSLLRPEIIRDLDLPRHGLEILPLDGTFTPMLNGDYLWRVNDHAKTRREIARHSRLDAEAYDEYGKAMADMGRFVKPILVHDAARPDQAQLEGPPGPALPGQALPRPLLHGQVQPGPADDHVRGRLPRPVVRDRRPQGDDVRQRHHRDVSRRAVPRNRLRPAPPLHGRDRRRLPLLGLRARGHRRDLQRDRRRGARGRRRDPDEGAHRPRQGQGRPRHGRRARERRGDRRRRRLLERRSAADLPQARGREGAARGLRRGRQALQVPRLLGQGQPRARRASGLPVDPGAGRAPARRDLGLAVGRVHGAGVRRRQVRPLSRAAPTSTW